MESEPLENNSHKENRVIKFFKRWAKELIIALILAVIAVIVIDPIKRIRDISRLHNSSMAVALISTYDEDHKPLGTGSGFFIQGDCQAEEGTLVTNYHVLEGADITSIEAKLPNSSAYYKIKGVIGVDQFEDIAILLFDAKDIPSIRLGNSDSVEAGENIKAVGWPLGMEGSGNSVTNGVISNPKRTINGQDLIQFTATISSGNSGGVLINDSNKVIGITSSSINIPSDLQAEIQAQNINLAVPINKVCSAIAGQKNISTKNSPYYYYSQATMASNQKNFDDAISNYKQAIEIDEKYVDAYLGLGVAYYEKGQFDLELEAYQKAIEIDPNNADSLWYLASAYEDLGKFDQALKYYQDALKVKPDDQINLYSLGIIYVVLGQKQNAAALVPALTKLNLGLGKEIELLSR